MVKRTRNPHHCCATPLHWLSADCSALTRRSSSTSRAWFRDRANNAILDQVLKVNETARVCVTGSDCAPRHNGRRRRGGRLCAARAPCIFLLISENETGSGLQPAIGAVLLRCWNERRNGGKAPSLCLARGGRNNRAEQGADTTSHWQHICVARS